jgi:hypothetical protein
MHGWPMGQTRLTLPFVRPDLGSFCRLDELGLQVAGQRPELFSALAIPAAARQTSG